jgi:hypothetical protein
LHKKEEYFSRKGAKTRSATAFLKGFLAPWRPLRENLFVIAALFMQGTPAAFTLRCRSIGPAPIAPPKPTLGFGSRLKHLIHTELQPGDVCALYEGTV